jgi:hypothetical protein
MKALEQYEVFNTKNDTEAPYLALRKGPSSKTKLLEQLPDGTVVQKLGEDGKWWRVRVPKLEKEGWVFSKFLRSLGKNNTTSSGATTAVNPFTPGVSVVNNFDEEGKNILFELQEGFVTLAIEDVFQRLNETKVVEKFGEDAGALLAGTNPMVAISIFREMTKMLPNADMFSKTPACYWNSADKTIDIVQPFFYLPLVGETNEGNVPNPNSKIEYAEILFEPEARDAAALAAGPNEQQFEKLQAGTYKNIYQVSNELGIGYKELASETLSYETFRSVIADGCVESFGLTKEFFLEMLEQPDKLIIDYNPKIPTTQRWGFFTYKIPVSLAVSSKANPIVEPINTADLLQSQQGTPFGVDMAHSLLNDVIRLDANNKQTKEIGANEFEQRLQNLTRMATKFETSMTDGNDKTIYAGISEDTSTLQKTVDKQVENIKNVPTFVKSSAVYGEITATALDAVSNAAFTINLHTQARVPKYISSVHLDRTVLTPRALLTLTLDNTITGGVDEIFLEKGKVVLIEGEIAKQIRQTLQGIEDFDSVLKEVIEFLSGRATNENPAITSKTTDIEYIYRVAAPAKRLEYALVYGLATIVRDGVMKEQLYIEGISNQKKIRKSVVEKGQLKNITNFDNLAGPYTIGVIREKKGKKVSNVLVEYTPQWGSLLQQFTWLNATPAENKVAIDDFDYRTLQVNRYVKGQNDLTAQLSAPELSFILATDDDSYREVNGAGTYKTFFDRLYRYSIYYKEKPFSQKLSRGKDILTAELTDEEKSAILRELNNRRNELIEQAFGGSGCVEFAVKSAQTIDDLYTTVLHKGNWALFVVKAVDRFKCELSKLGGGELACLANFDTMGAYQNTLKAIDTVTNFPEFLEKEAKENPNFPLAKLLFAREIPKVPSLDWFKCLRGFLISLLVKIIKDLIVAFVQGILSLLDIDCGADFSDCDQSDIDQSSSSLSQTLSNQAGSLAAAGLSGANAQTAANTIQKIPSFETITAQALTDFISQLATDMPIAHFKALLGGDAPQFIFARGKLIAENVFYPATFTDEEFRTMLSIINDSYEYDALIAATLFRQITGTDECPPVIVDGSETVEALKDALLRVAEESGLTDEQAEQQIQEARKELEERVSAFCELLNGSVGLLNEINTAPTLLAGFTNFALSGTITQLVTQLRIKPYFDYRSLRRLFVGSLDDKPDLEDVITADLSLAYGVLYKNYWLSQVLKDNGDAENRNYRKKFNLRPQVFSNAIGKDFTSNTVKLLRNDSFEKEFLQDLLQILAIINPFIAPLIPELEAAIFDVGRINTTERALLDASRELNNPNYFYAWAENLLALLPFEPDPRRFPAKYQGFVLENYPNAQEGANENVSLIEKDYVLKATRDDSGIRYEYTNGETTLLDLNIGLQDFRVELDEGVNAINRDLPKLSEPLTVNNEYDYDTFVNENGEFVAIQKVENPQNQVFLSVIENSIKDTSIYPSLSQAQKAQLSSVMNSIYNDTQAILDTKVKEELGKPYEEVSNFFFKPYLETQKIKLPDDPSTAQILEIIKKLKTNPKPPSVLFFLRSDNILSDVFFEDTVPAEVEKLINKVEASLKDFYKNLTDGELNEPKKLSNFIGNVVEAPAAFYETQRLMNSTSEANGEYFAGDWLGSPVLTKTQQEHILGAIKEVTGEQ